MILRSTTVLIALMTLAIPVQAGTSETIPLLVSTAWLSEHLEDGDLVLLHVGPEDDFAREHIPGARRGSLRDLIVVSDTGVRDEMPAIAALAEAIGALGVKNDSRVIIYCADGRYLPSATRLLLTLDYLGLGGQVAILDGGLEAWKSEKRPLSDEQAAAATASFAPSIDGTLIVDAAWVLSKLRARDVVLVDARPEEVYLGKVDHGESRPGHIPGAVNLPFFAVAEEESPQRFKSMEDLARLFADAGVPKDATVVAHCGTGIWACPVYFAAKLLGREVRFYDGSFQEWAMDPARPVIGPASRESLH